MRRLLMVAWTLVLCLVVLGPGLVGLAQTPDRVWTGNVSDDWFDRFNWDPDDNDPEADEYAADLSSTAPIVMDEVANIARWRGAGTGGAGRTLRILGFSGLGVSQDAFNDDGGRYTIEFAETFGVFNAGTEMYGFGFHFADDSFANSVAAIDVVGYGRVDVGDGSTQNAVSCDFGLIDPAYQAPNGDPIAYSRWTLTGESIFFVTAGGIQNVGRWYFLPSQGGQASVSGPVSIQTGEMSLFADDDPSGGELHVRSTYISLGGFDVETPRLTLPGTSQLRYVTFGQNRMDFSLSTDSFLEFTEQDDLAGAILRPRQLPPDPEDPSYEDGDYPGEVPDTDPVPSSLEIHLAQGIVNIETKVAREGKRWDSSFVDLFSRPGFTI